MKNQDNEPLYNTCCAYCEFGKWNEQDDAVFCKKKNKETSPSHKCRAFTYDLLKRKPQVFLFPDLEFPII